MVMIVDYGVGNVQAFVNLYKRLNISATVATTAQDLRAASKIVLPGVGAFDPAIQRLAESGMRPTLDELVVDRRVPVLGICVGMQMLGESSEEGHLPGLGWVRGRVRHLRALDTRASLQLPHMGWNDVRPVADSPLFKQLETDARFYFLHSFYFQCDREENVAALSTYGKDFPCAVVAENIWGVQFHPEKSHRFGTRLLKNFAEM